MNKAKRHLRPVAPENKRSKGKRLVSDLANVHRKRARLIRERSDLDIQIAQLDQCAAEILGEIAGNDVQLETGEKRRKDPRPPLGPPSDLERQAALEAERILLG